MEWELNTATDQTTPSLKNTVIWDVVHVVWYIGTKILNESVASIFGVQVALLSRICGQVVSPE
jgi:hypothetical protein